MVVERSGQSSVIHFINHQSGEFSWDASEGTLKAVEWEATGFPSAGSSFTSSTCHAKDFSLIKYATDLFFLWINEWMN